MKTSRSVWAETIGGALRRPTVRPSVMRAAVNERGESGRDNGRPSARLFLRQRAVVLFDCRSEAGRHFVRAGEEQLLLVAAHLLAEIELELLQPLDGRFEQIERLRIQRVAHLEPADVADRR